MAAGDHNHDSDYINAVGPDNMGGNSTSPLFMVTNNGTGHAIFAKTYSNGTGNAGISGEAKGDYGKGVHGYAYDMGGIGNWVSKGYPVIVEE